MRSIENTLALWVEGVLSSMDVVAWADREIQRQQTPPYALMELALHGPETCLKRSQADFAPRPAKLTFEERFALRAHATDLQAEASLARLSEWASRACMGEDLSSDFVALGYYLDHLLSDCHDKEAACEYARREVPKLLARCREIAARFAET